ncbi:MAG: hypothetical protein WA131_11045 [Desulfitobacteriaceae bacterium]
MNIFIREMKAHRKSLIIWCISVLLMVASGMSKYSVLSATGQSMNDLVAKMPRSVQTIMGLGFFDLTEASGYKEFECIGRNREAKHGFVKF